MAGWRDRWHAVVASDMPARDGLRWEFTSRDRSTCVWTVFRADGGPFPVFSAARGDGDLPAQYDLRAMTEDAVADLLDSGGRPDEMGWIRRNITAALLIASLEIGSWEGEEWALESHEDEPLAWADPGAARTPYAWLRARGGARDAVVGSYQDNAVFGLSFIPTSDPHRSDSDTGSRRPRRNLPFVTGRINQVEVVYDTTVEGGQGPGLVTEALLHDDNRSTLLIAAEAYSRNEWHLYDESVVALTDSAAADVLGWHPDRQRWQSTRLQRRAGPS